MPKLDHQPGALEVPREAAPHLPGIRIMSPTHDAILEAILANPGINLGEIAAHFHVTPSWMSCIVHSDCFQVRLAEARNELYGDLRLTVKDRVTALAHRSLARLAEKIEVENDMSRITDVAEMTLKSMGFQGQTNGRPTGSITQNNFFTADKEALAVARRSMMRIVGEGEARDAIDDAIDLAPAGDSPRPGNS